MLNWNYVSVLFEDPTGQIILGSAIGALVGAGIPVERAKLYEKGVHDGGIVMGVNARNDEDAEYLENDWKNNRGEYVYR